MKKQSPVRLEYRMKDDVFFTAMDVLGEHGQITKRKPHLLRKVQKCFPRGCRSFGH